MSLFIKRRKFFQYAGTLCAAFFLKPSKAQGIKEDCYTDADVQGPFFRAGAPESNDLARDYTGEGKRLEVKGTIYTSDCITPVVNAYVEVWHAGPDGNYDQYSDKFIFRGRIRTDNHGRYFFKTLIPSGYKDGSLDRPAHIHFKVTEPNHKMLVTQLYFEDDPKLATDVFIQQNNGKKRALPYPVNAVGVHQMRFDITLRNA